MAAPAFDTLRFARSLRDKAKLSPDQAEGFADAISEMMQGDLATKTDVGSVSDQVQTTAASIRAELQTTAASLRAELQATDASLKGEIRHLEARIDAKIESTKNEMLRWMIGAIGIQTLAILGALVTLARTLRP